MFLVWDMDLRGQNGNREVDLIISVAVGTKAGGGCTDD